MPLIECKKCGEQISSTAKKCPHCESKLNKSPMKIILCVILFFLGIRLIFSIFYVTLSDTNSYTTGVAITSNGVTKINNNDFSIIENKTTGSRSKDGTYTVKGQVKQNIEGSYTGINIVLNLLDENGKKVRQTTGLFYTEYIGNNLWEFVVSGNDADNIVTDYEIAYCYGY